MSLHTTYNDLMTEKNIFIHYHCEFFIQMCSTVHAWSIVSLFWWKTNRPFSFFTRDETKNTDERMKSGSEAIRSTNCGIVAENAKFGRFEDLRYIQKSSKTLYRWCESNCKVEKLNFKPMMDTISCCICLFFENSIYKLLKGQLINLSVYSRIWQSSHSKIHWNIHLLIVTVILANFKGLDSKLIQ